MRILGRMRLLTAISVLIFLAQPAAFAAAERTSVFSMPADVAVADGRVYVADANQRTVVILSETGQELGTFSGLSRPEGVEAVAGRLYVADSNLQKVVVFDEAGHELFSFGGPTFMHVPGRFARPRAIGSDGNFIYVGDTSGWVQKFTLDGQFVADWGRRPADRQQNGWLGEITGITADSRGVYVTDASLNKLVAFTSSGAVRWVANGAVGGSELDRPGGVAVAPDGSVYVSDGYENHASRAGHERMIQLDLTGRVVRQWGAACVGCMYGRGSDEPGGFSGPRGVAVADGSVWVADTRNHRVQRFAFDGTFQAELDG